MVMEETTGCRQQCLYRRTQWLDSSCLDAGNTVVTNILFVSLVIPLRRHSFKFCVKSWAKAKDSFEIILSKGSELPRDGCSCSHGWLWSTAIRSAVGCTGFHGNRQRWDIVLLTAVDSTYGWAFKLYAVPQICHLSHLCAYYVVVLCMGEGIVPSIQKRAIVLPSLKRPGFDPAIMANYQQPSNLSYLFKMVERVVCFQIPSYLESNSFNLFISLDSVVLA